MLFQGPSKRWIEARASGCDPFRVVTATAARAPTHRRRAHEQIDASCIFLGWPLELRNSHKGRNSFQF